MRIQFLLALVIASIAWHSTALPKDATTHSASSTNSTSSKTYSALAATGTNDVEAIDREKNKKVCVNYWPEKGNVADQTNPEGVVQQCLGICGNMTEKSLQDGQTHSVACPSMNAWQPASGTYASCAVLNAIADAELVQKEANRTR